VVLFGDPGYRKYTCAFHPAGRRPPPRVLALQSLGEPLGEALSVKPGEQAVGGMLVVHEEKTTESQSALMTNERRRLLSRKQLAGLFRLDGMEIKKAERLCELCASVVHYFLARKLIIGFFQAPITSRKSTRLKSESNVAIFVMPLCLHEAVITASAGNNL